MKKYLAAALAVASVAMVHTTSAFAEFTPYDPTTVIENGLTSYKTLFNLLMLAAIGFIIARKVGRGLGWVK